MIDPRASASVTAYAADRIFDGHRTWINHAIVIQNGVVTGIRPSREWDGTIPLKSYPGCTILPGLIDTHLHFMPWQGPQYLAYGITTLRDVGNELNWILTQRSKWPAKPWPRILCVGPLLDGPRAFHRFVARSCSDLSSAVTAVRETAEAGVDGIKLYVGLPPDWLSPMVREAHAAGLKVSMHCSAAGVLQAGRAGVDEFFHLDGILSDLWPDHPPGWLNLWGAPEISSKVDRLRKIADEIRELGLTATPTLAYWDSQWRARTRDYPHSVDLRHVPAPIIKWQAGGTADPAGSEQWLKALEAAQRFIGLLYERGVPILAGTDVPCGAVPPGLSLWRELQLLVGSGLSPVQAIRSATAAAADFLGHPELGCLTVGASADLVVVRGDPLDHIPELPEIPLVVRTGQAYFPAELLSATVREPLSTNDPWYLQLRLHAGENK
jgi:imidazolonepropionase-like amidohydrolase